MIIIINQTKIIITGEITKNNNHRGHLYLLGQTRSFPRLGALIQGRNGIIANPGSSGCYMVRLVYLRPFR